MIGAAPFSALALAGVLSDRASQKILVVNDIFPGNLPAERPDGSPDACDLRAARREESHPRVRPSTFNALQRAPLQN